MKPDGPRLLVIGAGRRALVTMRALRELGCEVVALDGMPDAPGFRLATSGLLASAFDPEAVVEAARSCAARKRIAGVLPTTRRSALAAAAVRDALGLPGTSLPAARRLADRLAVKRRLRAAGIAVPWCAAACAPAVVRQIVAAVSAPLVLKPVDGWAASGVVRLLDGVDVAWAHRVACFASPSAQAMIETYHAGRVLSVLALVAAGRTVIVDVVERSRDGHQRHAPFMIDAGHDRPDDLVPEERARLGAVAEAVADALDVGDGLVTCELVLGPDGPIVLDVTTDLGDGERCVREVPLAAGLDVVDLAVRLAVGEPLAGDPRPRAEAVARRPIFAEPGTVVSVDEVDRATESRGVAAVDLLVEPGGHVPPPTSNLCHAGAVVATGRDREDAAARAAAAAARVRVVTAAAERSRAAQ